METALVKIDQSAVLARAMQARETLERIAARAKEDLGDDFRSDNTKSAYDSDWRHFTAWCNLCGLQSMPAAVATVGAYISALAVGDPETGQAACKPATIERRLAAISVKHKAAGLTSPSNVPDVREIMKRIRRAKGTAQHRVSPLRVSQIRDAAPSFSDSLRDIRDKAILLIGYAGAFRRSEIAGLDIQDLEFTAEGVKITLRKSKTDQEGQGYVKGIGYGVNAETCPVKALRAWIDHSGIETGPVFRSIDRHGNMGEDSLTGKAISLIVKRIAEKVGIDPTSVSGHSLRAGFVTDQYKRGTPESDIMRQTGHKSRTVLSIYRREAEVFTFNYTAAVGL